MQLHLCLDSFAEIPLQITFVCFVFVNHLSKSSVKMQLSIQTSCANLFIMAPIVVDVIYIYCINSIDVHGMESIRKERFCIMTFILLFRANSITTSNTLPL